MSRLSATSLWRLGAVAALLTLAVAGAGRLGRDRPHAAFAISGASAERGRTALATYGCRTCHTIPGAGAFEPRVGPPLTGWADRRYIAGRLPNTPPNLVRWITNPQAVARGNAMPDVNVPRAAARDIAAYLYELP